MKSRMKAVFFALAATQLAVAVAAPADNSTLACETGPVQRQFGPAAWNIYACSDGKSVVIVPVKVINGEAGYFFVTPNGQGVTVAGEGWGKDSTFQPVYQQLQHITLAELKAIIQAANKVKPHHAK
jgi:hypothetical protein